MQLLSKLSSTITPQGAKIEAHTSVCNLSVNRPGSNFRVHLTVPSITSAQLWPVYCHEETQGPYTRYCDSDNAVSCSFRYGGRKIVRLFPDVVGILRCLEQVTRHGNIILYPMHSLTCFYILNRPSRDLEGIACRHMRTYLSLTRVRVSIGLRNV